MPSGRSRHAAQDGRSEVGWDGTGDADRGVGLVAVVGADDDAEAEAGPVGGVFVAAAQRAADKVANRGVQAQREPGGGLDPVPVGVVGVREQVAL
jgi:hypothetical protein